MAGSWLQDGERVAIDFEGRIVEGRRGETLAAALTAAGIRDLRLTQSEQPRGIFCGMGVCQECLVEIDGRANQRACMTKLARPRTTGPAGSPPAPSGRGRGAAEGGAPTLTRWIFSSPTSSCWAAAPAG